MSETKAPIVVVTGGTAGIGRATVREFARNGYDVAILARGHDGLEATRREVEDMGRQALAIPTDVSDWEAVEAAADRIEAELGPIDVWVNNAFAGIFARFMDVTPDEYERVTRVTYLGQVNGTRAALKRMLPRDRGKIVLVGSALAYRGIPLQSAYCGSKHAIQGFIDSVRCELLHDKTSVTITMVQMPGVNTPQFDWIRAKLPGQPRPVGKVYQPEVAGRAIFAAAHETRKEVLVGLPTVEAVWGNKVASSLLDDYLAETGFKSQQRPERVQPDRKDNLFEPVAGDHGAHGSFDDEAVDSSAELWVSENKKKLGLAAVGVAAAGVGFMLASRGDGKARERS
jgi:NAD(P)-dependent dehydrogenase (short-subunit alcohol dehydrogenase family)